MAQEQTAYAGDDIKVLVNVIDSTGSHVAATINTTTTRIDGNSAAPTVSTIATGIYQITFSGVTPAPAEGDRLTVKVNGDIGGTAWSEYGIPVKIVADERGTDNVVVPTSDITAIKAKTDQLAFTVANQVDANALTGGTSPGAIADAVWDEAFSDHNIAGSFGKALRQIKEGVITTESSINDSSATATTFVTALTEATDGFYHDKTMVFISGSLSGQARHIENYNGTTKTITVSQPFTSAPADGDEFLILATHEHSLSEIADSVWDESQSGHTTIGTFGYYVDARISEAGDATASNQTTIIGLLTGASVVVSQSSLKAGDAVEVRQGMDYNFLDGTAISWTGETDDQWPDLTGATVTFYAVQGATAISKTCTVTSPTGTQSFRLEFTASELSSDDAPLGNYRYYIIAVLSSGRKSALVEDGTFRVKQPY